MGPRCSEGMRLRVGRLVVAALLAVSCAAPTGRALGPATPAPLPSREPASLAELPWERDVIDGLRREGIDVALVGGSKFESMLGPRLPARVFIVRPGEQGADVLLLDRSLGSVGVCTSQKDNGSWADTFTIDGRVVSRAEGSQRALYSVSDRFFVQAFGERFDEALRKVLVTLRPPCVPAASDATRSVPGCPRTVSTDASGVTSTDGRFGMAGETYASATAVNDSFVLVRRGAAVGDQATVTFPQVGSSAPASSVWYGVTASPRQTPWGSAAFALGVKPIGFANSCWRVLIDGVDTGIVLAIGP